MTQKIHVLADESLGRVKREYVEVERKAEVGEKVLVFEHDHAYANGVKTVDRVEFNGHIYYGNYGRLPYGYYVLEPTDIVHIDENGNGGRYRLVDRKAEVGDYVIITNATATNSKYKKGDTVYAEEVNESGIFNKSVASSTSKCHNPNGYIDESEYAVLEPVESEQSPKNYDDIIANLVKRVAELERREEAQRRLNGVLSQRINAAQCDIETWAQEVEKTKREIKTKEERISDRVFPKIHTYSSEELNGKTLRILVGMDTADGVTAKMVSGIDEETGKIYVLNSEVNVNG
ncbi:hypothetical protein [Lederbergia citri]|uniref:Uncharacterized protein n=1 Tax=Lederbergia citri TaxID=2833580 RepID=A0A942TFP2_9BACI|nr:hypothetical protein [Lederbergia citri]MBS4195352.1 hypothetical protein [Lederbergia citri]